MTPVSAMTNAIRMMKFGDASLPEKFWAKVQPCPMTGCWIWTGCTNAKGYGAHGRAAPHSGSKLTHRFTYETAVGPLPPDTEIDHAVCRTRSCCNPDHLEAVSHRENIVRSDVKKDFCKRGHALAGDNLQPTKTGTRCRACVLILAEIHEAKRKAAYVPRPRILPLRFPCGHERSPENSVSAGGTVRRCRECNRRNSQVRNERLRREAG